MNTHSDISAVSVNACSRRSMLQGLAGLSAFSAIGPFSGPAWAADTPSAQIKQSVCLWCYNGFMKREKMNLDTFAAAAAKMGIKSIELVGPDQWPTLKKHGLICAMTPSHGIPKGLNRLENHDECLGKIRKSIDATAEAGFPNVITLSGNREGGDARDRDGDKADGHSTVRRRERQTTARPHTVRVPAHNTGYTKADTPTVWQVTYGTDKAWIRPTGPCRA